MAEPNDYLEHRIAEEEEEDHDAVTAEIDQYLYEVETYGEGCIFSPVSLQVR